MNIMKRRDFLAAASLTGFAAPYGSAAEPTGRKPRILAVSAHPADFCSRAGGTLAKHVKAGSKVKVVWLTHGETDESHLLYKKRPGISTEEVRKVREKEAFDSVGVIGAEGKMFGWGDGPLRMTPERMDMLAREMSDFKPDVILTHWKNELSYPTHWLCSKSVVEAAQMAQVTWDIRFFEATIGTATRNGFVPDHYVDITDFFDLKMEALKKLETQPQLLGYYTTCAKWRGLEMGRPYAEGFARWGPRPTVQELL